jgi:hypothetical protein
MSNDDDSEKKEAEKKIEIEVDGLLVLLEKFNIDPTDKHRWLTLALCLARRHETNWPNVKAVRGAPIGARTPAGKYRNMSSEKTNNLMLLAGIKQLKALGRPRVHAINPAWIDSIKIKHNLSGHGSDRKAIEIYVDKYVTPATRKSEIRYIQKRLSEQRRKIPKT